jgi:hypothetical protein
MLLKRLKARASLRWDQGKGELLGSRLVFATRFITEFGKLIR